MTQLTCVVAHASSPPKTHPHCQHGRVPRQARKHVDVGRAFRPILLVEIRRQAAAQYWHRNQLLFRLPSGAGTQAYIQGILGRGGLASTATNSCDSQ